MPDSSAGRRGFLQKEPLPRNKDAGQREGKDGEASRRLPAGGPVSFGRPTPDARLQQRQLQEAPARRRLRVLTPCNQISSVLGYTTEGRNNLFYKAVWFLKESHWL